MCLEIANGVVVGLLLQRISLSLFSKLEAIDADSRALENVEGVSPLQE
jgi:hypothetical protein